MHASSFSGDFAGFLSTTETVMAVAWPFALWFAVMTRESWAGRYDRVLCSWWTALLGLTFLTSHWVITPEAASLYIVPWFAITCLVRVHLGLSAPPALCAGLSFMQALCIDVTQATNQVWRGHFHSEHFLAGVGGAGLLDGLVLFPLAAYAMLRYAHWRADKKRGAVNGAS